MLSKKGGGGTYRLASSLLRCNGNEDGACEWPECIRRYGCCYSTELYYGRQALDTDSSENKGTTK